MYAERDRAIREFVLAQACNANGRLIHMDIACAEVEEQLFKTYPFSPVTFNCETGCLELLAENGDTIQVEGLWR